VTGQQQQQQQQVDINNCLMLLGAAFRAHPCTSSLYLAGDEGQQQ
jgi:hypothetical protein